MSLYDIRKDIEACVDAETGEIIDAEKLASLQVERDEKISNIACWIKNLLIDIEGIKAERKKLAERQAVMEHKAASLKAYLADFLDGKKWHDARSALSFRKTERIEIADGAVVPEEFLKTSVTVDKAGLKKAVQGGAAFDGVQLVEGQSIIVK